MRTWQSYIFQGAGSGWGIFLGIFESSCKGSGVLFGSFYYGAWEAASKRRMGMWVARLWGGSLGPGPPNQHADMAILLFRGPGVAAVVEMRSQAFKCSCWG